MATNQDFDETWSEVEQLLDLHAIQPDAEGIQDAEGIEPSTIDGDFVKGVLQSFMTLTTNQEGVFTRHQDGNGNLPLEWAKNITRIYLKLHVSKPNSNVGGSTGSSTSNPTIAAHPKMGELVQQASGMIIRMGGKPKADWSGLESKTTKIVEGQYRSLDKTKAAKRIQSIPRMKKKWKESDDFFDIQKHLTDTLKNNGMKQCMYLHDVFNDTKMTDVINNPHPYVANPEKLEESLAKILPEFDDWDYENDNSCRLILLESLSGPLSSKISKYYPSDEPFLKTYIRLVSKTKLLTPEAIEAIKKKIKETTLQAFNGMDADEACDSLLPLLNDLMSSGDYDPMLLKNFIESFRMAYTVESKHYVPFWLKIHNEILHPLETAHKQIKATKDLGPHQIERVLMEAKNNATPDLKPYVGLDRISILEKLKSMYNEKLKAFEWEAASAKTDTKAPPSSFGAGAVHLAEASLSTITEAVANALVQDLGSVVNKKSGGGRDKKFKGRKDKDSNKDSNGNKDGKKGKTGWKFTAPKAGEPHTKTDPGGTTRYWCQKCGRWTISHLTEAHGNGTDKSKSVNFVADLADEPCAWYTPVFVDNGSPPPWVDDLQPGIPVPTDQLQYAYEDNTGAQALASDIQGTL